MAVIEHKELWLLGEIVRKIVQNILCLSHKIEGYDLVRVYKNEPRRVSLVKMQFLANASQLKCFHIDGFEDAKMPKLLSLALLLTLYAHDNHFSNKLFIFYQLLTNDNSNVFTVMRDVH